MMLGREDHPLHTGTLERGDPLLDIEDGWVEGLRRGIAIAPL